MRALLLLSLVVLCGAIARPRRFAATCHHWRRGASERTHWSLAMLLRLFTPTRSMQQRHPARAPSAAPLTKRYYRKTSRKPNFGHRKPYFRQPARKTQRRHYDSNRRRKQIAPKRMHATLYPSRNRLLPASQYILPKNRRRKLAWNKYVPFRRKTTTPRPTTTTRRPTAIASYWRRYQDGRLRKGNNNKDRIRPEEANRCARRQYRRPLACPRQRGFAQVGDSCYFFSAVLGRQ